MRSVFAIFCTLALAALAGGCAPKGPSPTEKMNLWLNAQSNDIPPGVYHIEPPDVIAIQAPQIPELNGKGGIVTAEGTLTFNLVGNVPVAGKTPEQVANLLAQLCSKYYGKEALDIAVRVTEYRSKQIYVFGRVGTPGIKPFTGRDTILKVLADSRLVDGAWDERIVIVRPSEDPNVKQRVTLDLTKMYDSGDLSENILLEEGDLVYVPPTPLTSFGIAVNRVLFPFRPAISLTTMVMTGGI